jgi:putative transposase
MPRPPRIEYPGAFYHITCRGNEKKYIFLSDHDRNQFLHVLHFVLQKFNIVCHAYCLMNNHFHLLLETPDANLSLGMHSLNTIYTQRFNRIHDRVGHLFQGRYKSFLIEKEGYLKEITRYVVLNPVRASIVDHPKDWKWSSFNETVGLQKAHQILTTDLLLSLFGNKRKESQFRYERFVLDGIHANNPLENVREAGILGSQQYIDELSLKYPETFEGIQNRKCDKLAGRPSLEIIFLNAKNKIRRNEMIQFAYKYCGYSQPEIAKALDVSKSTIYRMLK